jgi:hypothetical protein
MGQVNLTHTHGISEGAPIMMSVFYVANHPAVTLFDLGASHTFINRDFVVKYQLPIEEGKYTFCIQSPGGHIYTKEMVEKVPINLEGHIFPTNFLVLQKQDIDVILGMNWLHQHGAIIDTLQRTV